MRTSYLTDVTHQPMAQERRKRKRYKIDCPVTVLTPGRGKKRMIGCGRLDDISDNGVRFHMDHSLAAGDRISLDVHFLNLNGEVIDIRFRGIVRRVSRGASHEIAVSFLKGESYLRRDRSQGRSLPRVQMNSSGRWIN